MPSARPVLAGPLLVGLLAMAALSACSASAASGGAVAIDDLPDVSTSAPPTAEGPVASAASGTEVPAEEVVAAVEDVLGGQASISRPVGDDGSRPQVGDDRVFILGDSIAQAAGPEYYNTFREQLVPLGWEPTVDAVRGRTTPQGLAALEKRRKDVHDVAVVLLGHNDPEDPESYRTKIESVVDELSDVPLVLLLTNYEFEDGRDEMNDELRVVAALHDNVELVDWNAVVDATKGAIAEDGLHLTEKGATALAATVAVTLGLAPGATDGDGAGR